MINPLNSDVIRLAYKSSLSYVEERCPELVQFFDDVWEIAVSKLNRDEKINREKDMLAVNFVGGEILEFLVNTVIPFMIGISSSLVAEGIFQKRRNSKEMARILEEGANRVSLQVKGIDKKTALSLLKYLSLDSVPVEQLATEVSDHLGDLLDTNLSIIYKQVSNDADLRDLLVHVQNIHPNFTSHGPDHSKAIIANFEKLLPSAIRNKFTPLEILILLCSAWLHDIGMADFEGKLAKCKNEDERRSLSKVIRETHSLSSEKYVTYPHNYKRLLLGAALAEIIGVICKAHVNEYNIMQVKTKWGPIAGYEEYGEVRVRLLAALLRLADACDLGYKRVKEVLKTVYNIQEKYVESIPHIDGALLITGVVVRGRSIIVQAAPRNSEQREWVKFLVKMLEEDFESVKQVLLDKKENGIALPYNEVRLETLEVE